MLCLRGNVFFFIKQFIVSHYSSEIYKKIVSQVSPGSQEILKGIIVSSNFYPAQAYQELLEAFRQEVSTEAMLQSAEYQAKNTLKGIFLFVATKISRERVIKNMSTMWRKVFSHGELHLLEETPHTIRVQVEGVSFNEAWRLHIERYFRTIWDLANQQKHLSWSKDINPTTTEYWMESQTKED